MRKELGTAEEAMKELGMARSTFFTRVKQGKINKDLEEDQQRGATYWIEVEEGNQGAEEKILGTKIKSGRIVPELSFRRARPEDAQEMFELGEKIMSQQGGYGIAPEKLLPFIELPNAEIAHVAIENNKIVGYFTVVPFTHEQAMRRMRNELRTTQFHPKDLPKFEPGAPIDCFIWEMMSDPARKDIGRYIIRKVMFFFNTLGKRGVDIQHVYATASSVEGINLSRKMGMRTMDLPHVITPQNVPFELKLQDEVNWITKSYNLAFNHYKRRQARLTQNVLTLVENNGTPRQAEAGETDWIKSSDMGNMYDLEYAEYGDETGNPSIIRKWYERNPYICRVLYNKADRRDFWGAINMLPLEEETIYKLLRGEIQDIDLDPQKDILTYKEPGTYNFYVASIIIHPQKRQHFLLLINSLFDFWCEQGPERKIGKIYGRIVSEHGELMAKKLFFSPMSQISESAYMLDINRPNPSRIIRSFQYCLKTREEEKQRTKAKV